MKNAFKVLLVLAVCIVLLSVIGGGIFWHDVAMHPDFSLSINGEDMDIEGLTSVPWYSVVFGLMVAGVVLCVLLPLVLLFSLGLPILLLLMTLGFVVFGLLSLGALLFSPFIVLALLLFLLFRSKRPRPSPRPGAAAT